MDFTSAFDRPMSRAAASLSLSSPGVATRLAQVLYQPIRCDGSAAPRPLAAPQPANDRHPLIPGLRAGRRALLRVIGR
jgi:hypothetical protein